jgi:hypothetical protein
MALDPRIFCDYDSFNEPIEWHHLVPVPGFHPHYWLDPDNNLWSFWPARRREGRDAWLQHKVRGRDYLFSVDEDGRPVTKYYTREPQPFKIVWRK